MTQIDSHVPITRYRHMQPCPGKNKHVELSRKTALDSHIRNKTPSIITTTMPIPTLLQAQTSRLNSRRRRRHTAPIAMSQPSHASCISSMDPDNHAAPDSSRFPSGIRNDATDGSAGERNNGIWTSSSLHKGLPMAGSWFSQPGHANDNCYLDRNFTSNAAATL